MLNYKKVTLCIGLYLALSQPLRVQAAIAKSFNLGLSATSYQLNKLSQKATGKPGTLGTLFYNLQLEYHLPLNATWLFSPRLNYMHDSISSVKSPENGSTSTLNYLILPVVKNVSSTWDFSGGLAILHYTIKGKGGSIEMRNGTSSAVFIKPGRTVSSTTTGLVLGGAYNYSSLRTALDFLIQGPINPDLRSYSLVLSFAWAVYKS